MPPDELDDAARLRLERDLYRGLLDLNAATELEPFLREALELLLRDRRRLSGVRRGLLGIGGRRIGGPPRVVPTRSSRRSDRWCRAGSSRRQLRREEPS